MDVIADTILEGLALDAFVLDALLKRHRCSHGRTIYFRRMEMVSRRLFGQRKPDAQSCSTVVESAVNRLIEFRKNLNQYCQEETRHKNSRKRRRHHSTVTEDDKEEQWYIETLHKDVNKSQTRSSEMAMEFKNLLAFWTRDIPELLSRIQHASLALFKEVTRGFFLPLCTVALSALARIRALLMDIGLRGITQLQELEFEAAKILGIQKGQYPNSFQSDSFVDTTTNYDQCMNMFVENEAEKEEIRKAMVQSRSCSNQDLIVNQNDILRSLGLMKSSTSTKFPRGARDLKRTIDANDDIQGYEKDSVELVVENSEYDDFHTLATTELSGDSDLEDTTYNEVATEKEVRKKLVTQTSNVDSFDSNKALVKRFKKQRKRRNQISNSEQKAKTEEKYASLTGEDLSSKVVKKANRRKSKPKDLKSKVKRNKKTNGDDFFDRLFD